MSFTDEAFDRKPVKHKWNAAETSEDLLHGVGADLLYGVDTPVNRAAAVKIQLAPSMFLILKLKCRLLVLSTLPQKMNVATTAS